MEKKKDLYADYNHKKYAHYRNIPTGEYDSENVKSAKAGKRLKPIMKKVKVPFEEVKDLRLDSLGTVAPTLDTEDFTIVSNYLVDFWGAVMGNCAVDAYLHLKRHAYGKKDYCYIDIELIALKMKRSKNATKGYLETLEEYGFIAMFNRKDTTDNNRDVSPLFKIRRYIPLITEEMYNELHPKLQKLHDEFMAEYEGISLNNQVFNTESVVESIVNNGQVINNKVVQERIEKVAREGKLEEYVLNTMSPEERELDQRFKESMETKVSKPSYETWIDKSVLIRNDDFNLTVLAPNEFAREWLENRYTPLIKQWAFSEINFSDTLGQIAFYTMSEYIEGRNRA